MVASPRLEATEGDNSTNMIITDPGAFDGETITVFFAIDRGRTIVTVPTGWSLVASVVNTNQVSAYLYWKIAASEPVDWTWSLSAQDQWLARVMVMQDADATSPIDTSDSNSGAAADAIVAPDITTTVDDCYIFRGVAFDGNASFAASETELFDWLDLGAGRAISGAGYTKDQVTAGAVGSLTITSSITNDWATITAAIKPAAGGAADPLAPIISSYKRQRATYLRL